MMMDYKRDILTDKCEFYKRVRRYENCLGMVVGSSEQTGRSHPFYECKAAICYALYQEGYPVSVIGKLMGVNHATVIYRIRQFYEMKRIGDKICSILYDRIDQCTSFQFTRPLPERKRKEIQP